MKLTRTTTILMAFGLLIGSLMTYVMLVRPAYDEILVLRGQIRSSRGDSDEKENEINQVQKLLSQYKSVADLRSAVSKALPLEAQVPQIAAQISQLAEKNFLALESMSFEEGRVMAAKNPVAFGVGFLSVRAELVGGYEDFRGFIKDVESNLRLMDIKSFGIRGSDEKLARENIFVFSFEFDAYYQTEEEIAPVRGAPRRAVR